jgi:predicted DCC family thiol-disulfide oxidoreductase YuxK
MREGDAIVVYYDGECRFCKHYARYLHVMKEYDLQLRNARDYVEEMKKHQWQWYDINDGMIVTYKEQIFHGAEAIVFLERKNTQEANRTSRAVPAKLLQWWYAALNFCRKIVLGLQGSKEIIEKKL